MWKEEIRKRRWKEETVRRRINSVLVDAIFRDTAMLDLPPDAFSNQNMDMFDTEDVNYSRIDSEFDLYKVLNRGASKITKRNMTILLAYYGVGYKKPYEAEDIAAGFRITKQRVYDIIKKVLESLSSSLSDIDLPEITQLIEQKRKKTVAHISRRNTPQKCKTHPPDHTIFKNDPVDFIYIMNHCGQHSAPVLKRVLQKIYFRTSTEYTAEKHKLVCAIFKRLTPQKIQILSLYFGVGIGQAQTVSEIAGKLKTNPATIHKQLNGMVKLFAINNQPCLVCSQKAL